MDTPLPINHGCHPAVAFLLPVSTVMNVSADRSAFEPFGSTRRMPNGQCPSQMIRATAGMRRNVATIPKLRVTVPMKTILAFATAGSGTSSNSYCSQITNI
jgi:hypothetical protein